MSFGVSISDVLLVLNIAKTTVQDCRHAPNDFAEASRVSQSLYLMLDGVVNEYQNPDSPLLKDDRTRTDFAIHFKNCEQSLKPLADLVSKHKRLATSDVRLIDRLRFPKKECLEYRGNLAFYTARLADFLQMVGLGSLGRIEQKVEDIKGHLPNLMGKIDQMCAEFRLMGDKESILSDHTNDEKFVWKAFRSKLNEAGFTSAVLREHETEIFLRIRELTAHGLVDTDIASVSQIPSTWELGPSSFPEESSPRPKYQAKVDSDGESERTLTPQSSVASFELKPPNPRENDNTRHLQSVKEKREVCATSEPSMHSTSPTVCADMQGKPRIWRNIKGKAILKGTFVKTRVVDETPYLVLLDVDKEEVLIPLSNVSDLDQALIDQVERGAPPLYLHSAQESSSPKRREVNLISKDRSPPSSDPEVIELARRSRPSLRKGTRTKPKILWSYRPIGSSLPKRAPFQPRGQLVSDALPRAAERGDLSIVKKLLASDMHIECKGPESWTETIESRDSEGNVKRDYKRHTYPETTALYRAAAAGWFDVAHFLVSKGADVNTQDGYNGTIGDPILFDLVRKGQERMAKLLLEYGARIDGFGSTNALHIASNQPKVNLVRLVLDYGASINAGDRDNETPLYKATAAGFHHNVEMLLQEGAQTDKLTRQGRTALYKAGGAGRDDIVAQLLRYGADSSLGRGRYGETLLYKAAWYNEIEIVDLLLLYDPDIVTIRNRKEMKEYKSVSEKILHGVFAGLSTDHAIMNTWRKTALHAAAQRGYEEVTQMLIDGGADVEAVGKDGQTPLYLAAKQKHKGVVQLLLKSGAKLETEKHDPVIALMSPTEEEPRRDDDTGNRKGGKELRSSNEGKQLVGDFRNEMSKMGTTDLLVGMVATGVKNLSSARRLKDTKR